MATETVPHEAAKKAEAAERLLLMLRADLLSAMRMLDHSETRRAHARLAHTVAALDDTLAELGS